MKVRRGAVGVLVNELIADGLVFEGAKGETKRGRKPHFLYIDSRGRCVVAVDIRASRTFIMVTDILGRPLARISSFPTPREPDALIQHLAQTIEGLLKEHAAMKCQGIGVVVPGMVDHQTSRILQAPTLGWRDVSLREPLSNATGFSVYVENPGKACVLAQMWTGQSDVGSEIVFVNISDGVGVGVIVNGSLLRGRHDMAGEFGHVPLSIDGPRCSCGASGCWETYVSNLATLSRYLGHTLTEETASAPALDITVDDVIARARSGDAKAIATVQSTARYLGLGLGSIVNAIDPTRIYLSGEITGAWDMIEAIVRSGLKESALTPARGLTELAVVPVTDYPRLRGAATLVVIPTFAAPGLA
jgi:N-acetylglucosamine repressor